MGVIDTFNALDDKAGVPRTPSRRTWERNARWWWVQLVLAVVCVVAAVIWDLGGLAFFGASAGFVAGFFYNERLRLLGRTSRIPAYRRPD